MLSFYAKTVVSYQDEAPEWSDCLLKSMKEFSLLKNNSISKKKKYITAHAI